MSHPGVASLTVLPLTLAFKEQVHARWYAPMLISQTPQQNSASHVLPAVILVMERTVVVVLQAILMSPIVIFAPSNVVLPCPTTSTAPVLLPARQAPSCSMTWLLVNVATPYVLNVLS